MTPGPEVAAERRFRMGCLPGGTEPVEGIRTGMIRRSSQGMAVGLRRAGQVRRGRIGQGFRLGSRGGISQSQGRGHELSQGCSPDPMALAPSPEPWIQHPSLRGEPHGPALELGRGERPRRVRQKQRLQFLLGGGLQQAPGKVLRRGSFGQQPPGRSGAGEQIGPPALWQMPQPGGHEAVEEGRQFQSARLGHGGQQGNPSGARGTVEEHGTQRHPRRAIAFQQLLPAVFHQVGFLPTAEGGRDPLAAMAEQGDPRGCGEGVEAIGEGCQARTFWPSCGPAGERPAAILASQQPSLREGGERPGGIPPASPPVQPPGGSPGAQPSGLESCHRRIPSMAFQSSQNVGMVLETHPGFSSSPPQRSAPTAAAKAMRWSLRGSKGARSPGHDPGWILRV